MMISVSQRDHSALRTEPGTVGCPSITRAIFALVTDSSYRFPSETTDADAADISSQVVVPSPPV